MRIKWTAASMLAGIGAVGVLVLAPGAADAASGSLTINGTTHSDPSGKYWGRGSINQVVNNTDEPATVSAFTTGGYEMYLGTVLPGQSRSFSNYSIVVNIK